jgi:hypothetical protein
VSTFDAIARLVYVACAAGLVIGLQLTNSAATAAGRPDLGTALVVAILTTALLLGHHGPITSAGVLMLMAGAAADSAAGLYAARRVAMTATPQLVSLFNAVAARPRPYRLPPGNRHRSARGSRRPARWTTVALDACPDLPTLARLFQASWTGWTAAAG